ncbi:MAG: nucleotidyltransferase domain-containing protein [Firmicutes bacterium]|nr:nucleotidyltransferase domain-containing protein [Bacillota bacterium]
MPVLSTTEKEVLKSFVEYLNRIHPGEITKIILYGSRARGDHLLDSDMDILVLVKDKKIIDRDKIYDFVLDSELEHGIDISVNIYESEQFSKLVMLNTPFATNVVKKGETLWTLYMVKTWLSTDCNPQKNV